MAAYEDSKAQEMGKHNSPSQLVASQFYIVKFA